MALIEVDEAQFQQFQREAQAGKQARAVLDKLGANPGTKKETLRLLKKADPTMSIPEIDAEDATNEQVAKLREELAARDKRDAEKTEAEEKRRTERNLGKQIEKGRDSLKTKGYSDEGIAEIEKLMGERGVADYDAGRLLFEEAHPKEEPIMPSSFNRGWDFGEPSADKDDKVNLLLNGVGRGGRIGPGAKQFVNHEIQATLRDMRGGARRSA